MISIFGIHVNKIYDWVCMAIEKTTTFIIKGYGFLDSSSFLGSDGASHKLAFFI